MSSPPCHATPKRWRSSPSRWRRSSPTVASRRFRTTRSDPPGLMLTPAGLSRRVLQRFERLDPEHDAFRRSSRVAITLPVATAIAFAVGGGPQTLLFTIVGSVALLIL